MSASRTRPLGSRPSTSGRPVDAVDTIGAAVIGLAGAMMVTLDGLLNPGGYAPLRYTFLVWVMVIVGGSGNNWGAVLGAVLIWFLWIKAEVWGPALMSLLTLPLSEGGLRRHLIEHVIEERYAGGDPARPIGPCRSSSFRDWS